MKEHPIETKWLQFRKQNIELIEMAENIYEEKWDEQYGPKNEMVAGIPMGITESIYALLQFRDKAKEERLEAARKAVVGEQQGEIPRAGRLRDTRDLPAKKPRQRPDRIESNSAEADE